MPGGSHARTMADIDYRAVAAVKLFCQQVRQAAAGTNYLESDRPLTPDDSMQNGLWPQAVPSLVQGSSTQWCTTPTKAPPKAPRLMTAVEAAEQLALGDCCSFVDKLGQEYTLFRKARRQSERELQILRKMFGQALLPRLLDFWASEDEDTFLLLFEALEVVEIEGPSRFDFLPTNDQQPVSWWVLNAVACAMHTLCGLYVLHHRLGVVHGNISAASVMFSRKRALWKLTGFENARTIDEAAAVTSISESSIYCAPELVRSGTHTTASDVYALGMALNVLWFSPLYWHIVENGYGEKGAASLFDEFYPIIDSMTIDDPTQRLTVVRALRMFYNRLNSRIEFYPEFEFVGRAYIYELIRDIIISEDIMACCPPVSQKETPAAPPLTATFSSKLAQVKEEEGKLGPKTPTAPSIQ